MAVSFHIIHVFSLLAGEESEWAFLDEGDFLWKVKYAVVASGSSEIVCHYGNLKGRLFYLQGDNSVSEQYSDYPIKFRHSLLELGTRFVAVHRRQSVIPESFSAEVPIGTCKDFTTKEIGVVAGRRLLDPNFDIPPPVSYTLEDDLKNGKHIV